MNGLEAFRSVLDTDYRFRYLKYTHELKLILLQYHTTISLWIAAIKVYINHAFTFIFFELVVDLF